MADSTANLSKLKEEENKNEELLKQFMESQEELDRLNSGVLPFGWSYFPFGPSSPKPWSRTSPGFQTDPCSKAWQIWGGRSTPAMSADRMLKVPHHISQGLT